MKNVLVLCTGNSCRSVMAEALINHLGNGAYKAVSAGSKPAGFVHPKSIETLKRHGIEAGTPRSKSWDEFEGQNFDLVITVCDAAASEACPVFFGQHKKLHWPTPDPAAATGSEDDITAAFDEAFTMLKERVERELLCNYEQEFKIFSSNINQAARAFYYHQEFQRQIYDDGIKHQNMPNGYFQDSKLFQAVQDNAQFWMDYKHCGIVFTVIVLGRIFDKDTKYQKSHHIERLIESAKNSGLFTNKKLRERKIKGSDNSHEWIDNFMKNTHELSQDDFKNISDYAKETRKKWESVKDLRNKIYAHQDVIDDLKKNAIFEKSQYLVFEEIIQRLLTLENVFLEAFSNGRAPDFDFKNKHIKNAVLIDVKLLLEKISNDK